MAVVANTVQTTAAKVNRESLGDVISMITPRDTPLYSGMSKGTMSATYDEWVQRNLRAPGANAQLEGDQYAYNAFVPSVRVGNYSQIIRDSAVISRTQDKVKNAGNSETTERAKLETGLALRKDVELQIVSNAASVGGATRVSGGLPSWITTNASRGATGANGGFNTGTKLTVAETTGTQRAFTQTLLDDNLQSVYQSGGDVTDIMISPYLKRVFVTFMSNPNVAVFRHPVENGNDNRIISNAEYYDGPHGTVRVVQNRVMGLNAATARRAFLIDWGMLKYKWLRPIAEDPEVTINADARAFVLVGEGSLEVQNEQGLGVIADLFGMNAAA